MMLSALFNVSIDEMVKGDLEIMNNMNTELDAHKFKMWFIVQIICLALFTASIIVSVFLPWWGLIIPTGFIALFFIAYIPWMRIAKKHKLKTFGEMKAFIKNTERPVYTKPPWYIRHKALFYLLTILISTVSAVIVFSILFYLFVPEFFTELFGE
jgi:polyferredoxin